MATKKLARTVIEGGRTHWSKWQRRHSHRVRRASDRAQLHKSRNDLEVHEGQSWRRRPKVYKQFFDKLGPCYRWLGRHVGKPWNDVHQAIMSTFDTRSLAGRHIVFDHMLASVALHEVDRPWHRFYVDERGLLRERKRRRLRTWRLYRVPDEIAGWCDGRRIGRRGKALFWFVPVHPPDEEGRVGACRQHRRLTAAEAKRFDALPEGVQKLLLYLDE